MLFNLDHVKLAKQLKKRTNIAQNRAGLRSNSKDLSEAQKGYLSVLEGLVAERDIEHPFAQDAEGIASFFKEASERWSRKKIEMGL
jgi:hypothetical protein